MTAHWLPPTPARAGSLRGGCDPQGRSLGGAAALGCPLQFRGVPPTVPPQGKELPTLKDVDFLNKNEKVFVEEEQQHEFMDKLKRDVEVGTGGLHPQGI